MNLELVGDIQGDDDLIDAQKELKQFVVIILYVALFDFPYVDKCLFLRKHIRYMSQTRSRKILQN